MITWIQKTLQQRVVFLLLLGIVIMAFVFWGSGSGRNNERKAVKRPFFGLDLGNIQDQARLERDGFLSAMLLFQGREADPQQYYRGRHAMLHIADQLRIPAPTDAEIRAYIQNVPMFMAPLDQTNTRFAFDASRYNTIRQNPMVLGVAASPADLARVLADDARIAATGKLLVGPGYILPYDVQQRLKRIDTSWTLQTATIERASFKPAITPIDLELGAYFDANRARYTITPRVRVSYAEIPAASFAAAITISGTDARAFYDANPARFPKPAAAPPISMAAPSTPDNDFNLARPQVEAALRQQRALAAANKAASDLAYKSYTDKTHPGSPEFDRLVSQAGATFNPAIEFSAEDGPAQFAASSQGIAREAFALDATQRVSNVVNTGTSAIVLFWEDSIPAREPDLAEVRDKVSADFIAQENQKQFTALGRQLKAQIQAALATGAAFEQAASSVATDAGLIVTTRSIPAFSIRALGTMSVPPENLDTNVLAALDDLAKGGLSDMSTIAGGDGRFVYAQEQVVPDLTEANPSYAEVARDLASSNASTAVGQHQRGLIEAELAKSNPENR